MEMGDCNLGECNEGGGEERGSTVGEEGLS